MNRARDFTSEITSPVIAESLVVSTQNLESSKDSQALSPLSVTTPEIRSDTWSRLIAPIAGELNQFEREMKHILESCGPHFSLLIKHLEQYRGKRLRPVLLLLVAQACGRITQEHRTLAVVLEMIHTATLVHDDVLDEAQLRRHVPTINSRWGNAISILLGDTLFTRAFHLASTIDTQACRLIGEATNRVCAGELRQACESGKWNLTEEAYFSIIADKTATLTECCSRLGATYAGASIELTNALANFGHCLGLAFQITDDILDLIGDEKEVGKTLGTDLAQLKLTLPLIHCLRSLPSAESQELKEILTSGHPHFREKLLDTMEKTRSIDYAMALAERHVAQAKASLKALPPSQCRDALNDIAGWAMARKK